MDATPARPARPRAAARRRKKAAIASVTGVLVLLVGVIVAFLASSPSSSPKTAPPAHRAEAARAAAKAAALTPAAMAHEMAVFPAKHLNLPAKVPGARLHEGAKPKVLYIGAEWCPFCAAERWAVVTALSKFGTFSNLGLIHSSSSDVYPSTATFSFHKATYHSDYLAFSGFEVQTVDHQPLDKLPGYASKIEKRLDPAGDIPLVDLGGRLASVGAAYPPQVLQHLSAKQIAADLHRPDSQPAVYIDAAAGDLTAQLCELTHGSPARVCRVVEHAKGGPRGKQHLG